MKGGKMIFISKGAFGASPLDTALDTTMRTIAIQVGNSDDWVEKYGADYENEVFMMHSYCWCENDDCPWCTGCDCPATAFHYYVDDLEVSFDEWMAFYKQEVGTIDFATATEEEKQSFWKRSDEANRRRNHGHDKICDFCRTGGVAASKGGEAGKPAPNFWYKGGKHQELKVWWYKYIGRDMETNRPYTKQELKGIREHCLKSVKEGK
jgi:hypothetical protein